MMHSLSVLPAVRRAFGATAGIATLLCCAGCAPSRPRLTTPDPASAAPLARFTDMNADPRVVEVTLEARPGMWELSPGRSVRAMTYNGSVPGPLLEARVGDTVVVHFTNRLSEPTTIHWHGIRLPSDMDGSPHSQPPVAPGGSFEYRFTVPDAGLFWYHPHVNESVQMEQGLYGAIVVRGASEVEADAETVLILDDLLLGPDGQIAPTGDLNEQHTGREGGLLVVNGRAGVTLPTRSGQRQRWRIVNAGSARFYRLALADHAFTLIGTDEDLLSAPRIERELMVVPGDRVDVLVDETAPPGTRSELRNLPYDRGHGGGITVAETVLALQASSEAPVIALPAVQWNRPIQQLNADGATPYEVRFNEHIDRVAGRVVFTINDRTFPDVPDVTARVGETQVWDLVNESEMEHPFHLHGFFFHVLTRNGVREASPSWEDTMQLRGHERVRIAFRPDDRLGHWMYHCHMLEHVTNGMMATMVLTR